MKSNNTVAGFAQIGLIFIVLCTSCETRPSKFPQDAKMVALPHIQNWSVRFENGLQKDEAHYLSEIYFDRFIGSCGAPGEQIDCGEFWCIPVYIGWVPVNEGWFWFAKDGQKLFFEPHNGRLSTTTKHRLKASGVRCDAVESVK